MADILYTYKNQVYANITNRCNCNCTFCVRSLKNAVGDAETLWHKTEPTLAEIINAIDNFDFTGYEELVFCGYGEPTCALENLLASAAYAKKKYAISIRLNTNGLGNLYHNRNIIPELAAVIDSVSISLNAPTAEKYEAVTRPQFKNAIRQCSNSLLSPKQHFNTHNFPLLMFFLRRRLLPAKRLPMAAVFT